MLYYCIFTIFALITTLLLSRKFSFLLVYFISSMIFYFPALLGRYYYHNTTFHFNSITYITLALNIATVLFIYFFFFNKKEKKVIRKACDNDSSQIVNLKVNKVITFLIIIIQVYFFMYMKSFIFDGVYDKSYIMANTPKTLEYFMYFITFWNVYLFTCKEGITRFEKAVGLICLFFTFLMGNRSFISVTFVGIISYLIDNNWKDYSLLDFVRKNKSIFVKVIVAILIIFMVKGIYSAFFAGDYRYVRNSLSSTDYYIDQLKQSEPNVISRNLDFIIMFKYKSSKISYFQVLKLIIPGMTKLTGYDYSFSDEYQIALYGSKHTNNASTFLGEAYSHGGLAVVFVVILCLSVIIGILWNLYIRTKDSFLKCFILVVGVDFSFYICRNDIAYEYMRFRYYLYGFVLLLIIKWIIKVIAIRGKHS